MVISVGDRGKVRLGLIKEMKEGERHRTSHPRVDMLNVFIVTCKPSVQPCQNRSSPAGLHRSGMLAAVSK